MLLDTGILEFISHMTQNYSCMSTSHGHGMRSENTEIIYLDACSISSIYILLIVAVAVACGCAINVINVHKNANACMYIFFFDQYYMRATAEKVNYHFVKEFKVFL